MQFQLTNDAGQAPRGTGRTVSLSSREIVFQSSLELRPGSELDVTVAWPVSLQNGVGLQLAARAYVHQVAEGNVTASIRSYQFRTRSAASRFTAGTALAETPVYFLSASGK
jgi:hypothetical protein